MKKNVAIIGLGGVGGYFGFKIAQRNLSDSQHHISFVARGKTLETVEKNGLTLLSAEHENPVTRPDFICEDLNQLPTPDLVFICVKEYDLEVVCQQLKNAIHAKTILIPMMNGADIYDRIKKTLPRTIVLPSCVYVVSHIKQKGIVAHKGISGKLIFGKDPSFMGAETSWIIQLLEKSKIVFDFHENAFPSIWTKFMFIASFGLVSAKHNSSVGAVGSEPTQKEEATNIMKEIKAIADALKVELLDDIIQATFTKAATFPADAPTSLQLDVNSGKGQHELEVFAGAILNYGEQLSIATPATKAIYQDIKQITG